MDPLAVLNDIRIASPCHADWDAMAGDDRVRYCGSCEKHVYNLSAMPAAEAAHLMQHKEGRMCIRLYRRADGTFLSSDCPVGARRAKTRAMTRRLAIFAVISTLLTLLLRVFITPKEPPAATFHSYALMGAADY